jgi:AcrR family transcriptional regulator
MATQCFLEYGYEGASIDTIAAAARVSKVTLYARYPDKESLFQAVIENKVRGWTKEASDLASKGGNTLERRLRHHITLAMERAASDELRAFDRLIAGAPPKTAHVLHDIRYNNMVRVLEREIAEFSRAEGKPAQDPRRIASDLMALLAGWFRMETMGRSVSEKEAVAFGHHVVDLIMAARAIW